VVDGTRRLEVLKDALVNGISTPLRTELSPRMIQIVRSPHSVSRYDPIFSEQHFSYLKSSSRPTELSVK